MGSAISAIKANKDFLYNRVFGVGLFKLFGDAGIETVDNELLTKYANKLGYRYTAFKNFYVFVFLILNNSNTRCFQPRCGRVATTAPSQSYLLAISTRAYLSAPKTIPQIIHIRPTLD